MNWYRADDPRLTPESRAMLAEAEERDRLRVAIRRHVARAHGSNRLDACGCRLRLPASALT